MKHKFTIFDDEGYRLEVTDISFGGSLLSPRVLIAGRMIDPFGNGIMVEGIELTIDRVKAILAFFAAPDDASVATEAKKAAGEAFTGSVKGLMLAARNGK